VYARPTAAASCATIPPPAGCNQLETHCPGDATQANGQCQGGHVTVVIPAVAVGATYLVEVVNPGAPPQASASMTFTVATTCGTAPACP
jgi:hypothetical protein